MKSREDFTDGTLSWVLNMEWALAERRSGHSWKEEQHGQKCGGRKVWHGWGPVRCQPTSRGLAKGRGGRSSWKRVEHLVSHVSGSGAQACRLLELEANRVSSHCLGAIAPQTALVPGSTREPWGLRSSSPHTRPCCSSQRPEPKTSGFCFFLNH